MKRLWLILLATLLFFPMSASAQSDENTILHHRGDTARSGVISGDPLREFSGELGIRWQIEIPNPGYSSPLVIGDVLYIGSMEGHIRAIDTATGDEIWQVQPLERAVSPIQAWGDQLIVIIGDTLFLLDRATGATRWQFAIGESAWFSQPLIIENIAYFGSAEPRYFALDLTSQTVLWQVATASRIYYYPAAWGDTLIFSGENHLIALNRQTGEKIWQADLPSADWGPYAIGDGTIFAGALDGSFYAVDVATGDILWRARVGSDDRPVWSPPIVSEGVVYAGYSNDTFYAFDAATGDTVWEFATEDAATGEPILVGDVIYFGLGAHSGTPDDAERLFYAIDAATGEELWSVTLTGTIYTSPAIGEGGSVFVATAAGQLYALE